MANQYIMVVEQFPSEDMTTEFRMVGDGENVPQCVVINDSTSPYDGYVFVRRGKYAEKGDRFAFLYVNIEQVTPMAHHGILRHSADRWVAE